MRVRRRERGDHGAAAVEFALVVPVLVLLVLGIVDYGIYFVDTTGARQGVREGARQGVVENFPAGACADPNVAPTGGDPDLNQLACQTLKDMGIIGGRAFLRIEAVPDWEENADLLLCAAVDETALTGYTPLPRGGDIRSVFRMRIEQADDAPPGRGEAYTDPSAGGATQPSGGWGWCV